MSLYISPLGQSIRPEVVTSVKGRMCATRNRVLSVRHHDAQLRHSGTLGAEHKAIFCPSSLFTVHRRGRGITHT